MTTRKFIIPLLLTSVLLTACGGDVKNDTQILEISESTINEEQTVLVKKGTIENKYYIEAQVGPMVKQLKFPKEGLFGEYKVNVGDSVSKGDVIATVSNKNLDDAIYLAKKEVENITVSYEYNVTTLNNEKKISQIKLEEARANLDKLTKDTPDYDSIHFRLCQEAGREDENIQRIDLKLKQLKETYELQLPHAKSELNKLEQEASGNVIVAPFDGVVVALEPMNYGQELATNKYYAAVADPDLYYARCLFPGASIVKNAEKTVFLSDGREYELEYVNRDEDYYMAMRNSAEDNYAEYRFLNPEGVAMGTANYIKIVMSSKSDVLLLPEDALYQADGFYYVYRDNHGSHEKVTVKIGLRDSLNVEITEGLEEGDVIYVQ